MNAPADNPATPPRRKNTHTGPMELSDAKVTVVGLGRFGGGLGVTRWLRGQGAKVTISDKATADQLADSLKQLQDLDVTLHLGSHEPDDFLHADLLVINPAVPADLPLLAAARTEGVAQTTEINLFIERCRAPIVGITGTVGKSTTTAMLGGVLSTSFRTHVGGNIGVSLLDELDRLALEHVVVLELSSFQLEHLGRIAMSPEVAVVTNLSPNHLDRHKTMSQYAQAKKNIFRWQSGNDVLVLNSACDALADWAGQAPARVEFFDPAAEPFELSVVGAHNQANAQAAWAAAKQFGIERANAAPAIKAFAPLSHRLQFVAERGGVRYYNDSKCTTADGAIVALEAFGGPAPRVVILAGGYDKGVNFDRLGLALSGGAKAVIAMGATRDKIAAAVEKHRTTPAPVVLKADGLADAVALARGQAHHGDVVLLSPACASYDMFDNYEQRGRAFTNIILQIPSRGNSGTNSSNTV